MSLQRDSEALRGSRALQLATARRLHAPLFAGALLSTLAACGPSSGSTQVGDFGPDGEGQMSDGPGGFFINDANEGGVASNFLIERIFWGRLVEVFDRDALGGETLVFNDFVAPQDISTGFDHDLDGTPDFELDKDPLTGKTRLIVLHPLVTSGVAPSRQIDTTASADFLDAIAYLNDVDNFDLVLPKSLSQAELPPFSAVARNAAVVVRMNDLLDASTVSSETVRVFTGVPPTNPYEPRLIADPRHGAIQGGVFRSTRILIDLTVSADEAATTGAPLNELGLPPATTDQKANVALRIPRVPGAGLFEVLSNSKGKILSLVGNAPEDPNSVTQDVVRGFRSGSPSDPFNGFLPDSVRPKLVARQRVSVLSAPAPIFVPPASLPPSLAGTPDVWVMSWTYDITSCSFTPRPGDQILFDALPGQTGVLVEVLEVNTPPVGGLVSNVFVQLKENGSTGVPAPGPARFITTFDGTADEQAFLPCFLTVSPTPTLLPLSGVSPVANFTIEFDEAMDPDSVRPFDSFVLSSRRDASDFSFLPATRPWHKVIGKVTAATDLKRFVFSPVLPLSHQSAVAETYFANIVTGLGGVRDLAGNAILVPVSPIRITLNPGAAQNRTGGYALNFSSADEDGNDGTVTVSPAMGGGSFQRKRPELRGQIAQDLANGTIFPRSVTRFSRTIERDPSDPDNLQNLMLPYPTGGLPTPYDNGVRDPFLPHGSRLMTMWRYADMKLKVNEEATYNIDVEGMAWSTPLASTFTANFPHFQIALAHSRFLPDEGADVVSATLAFPNSGLLTTGFQDNVLVDPQNALTIVHEGFRGYIVDPSQDFLTASENLMQPFPLNRGIPEAQKKYYTWRNTAILAVGGDPSLGPPGPPDMSPMPMPTAPQPSGLDILAYANTGTGNIVTAYADNTPTGKPQAAIAKAPDIPSIGMPLLMDFQVNPSSAISSNIVDHGDPWGLGVPVFRIFSSGGFDTASVEQIKFPSQQISPDGGFNTVLAFGPLGTPTAPADTIMYMGQVDFVVRVSRAFTVWIMVHGSIEEELDIASTGGQIADQEGNATFKDPITEFFGGTPPVGTGLVLAFRGGTITESGNPPAFEASGIERPWRNANLLDAYGDQPSSSDYTVKAIEGQETSVPFKYLDAPSAKNASIAFQGGTPVWKNTIAEVNGSQFFQVRLTFVSDPVTGGTPVLSTLAFAWDLSN